VIPSNIPTLEKISPTTKAIGAVLFQKKKKRSSSNPTRLVLIKTAERNAQKKIRLFLKYAAVLIGTSSAKFKGNEKATAAALRSFTKIFLRHYDAFDSVK
jgi:hypothetical protein